ncbi:MAG: putative toxin-antitoxin system toxin component, PIN family [Bacteroidota bacterium]
MTIDKPRVILDTNIFLVSLVPHFKYYWVFEKLLAGDYSLVVSNEILSEYEEKIVEKFGLALADSSLDFLMLLNNVELVNPYYNWNLITRDPDDNKFVDGAVSGNVDYLITNDKHFNILKEVEFPPINVINLAEFEALFEHKEK